jgi:hypothetical protein
MDNINMKKINITKYKGNTHYNIHETKNIYDDSLDKAIQNCIELDNKAGRENGGLSVNK